MGFCTPDEYQEFMRQVPEFEHMLTENGVDIIKALVFDQSRKNRPSDLSREKRDPLKQWKLSPVDLKSQQFWNEWTHHKEEMFSRTHTSYAPWIIIKTNNKKIARLESIRYLLSRFDYRGKMDAGTNIYPDPNVVQRFHRSMLGQS